MKIALIPPIAHQDLNVGDINMALTCFDDCEQYTRYFKESNKWTIVDNGAAENEQASVERVLAFAHNCKADEIVLMDHLFDGKKTVKKTLDMLKQMTDREKRIYSLMAVPQGKSPKEFLDCFKKLWNNPEVNVIGLSKIAVVSAFGKEIMSEDITICRIKAFIEIQKIVREYFKPITIHLLGMGSLSEPFLYQQMSEIRSIDSCYPIHQLLNKDEYGIERTKPAKNYFEQTLDKKQLLTLRKKLTNYINKIK